jgi:CBS domain containing-hemolysin-like protein
MTLFVSSIAVVLAISFLCSICESVLLTTTTAQAQALARTHRHGGQWLAGFKRSIDRPIAAILILNTASHTVGAAVGGATYVKIFDPQTLWIFSIAFTLAVLLFTEIVPKTLGVAYRRPLALPVAIGIRLMVIVLYPLVVVSERISRALRGSTTTPVTSVEEIRLLAAIGRNEGAVGVRTAAIITGATYLKQLTAGDVMLPRQHVVFLSSTMSRSEVLVTVRDTGYSRYPFVQGSEIDQITGIVLAKELLYWLQDHPDAPIDWTALVREPIVVAEGTPLNILLRTFQDARVHLGIVVDEYGGVEGVVSLEDVIEEVVGEIFDESDTLVEDTWLQEDGSLHARGTVELLKVCKKLDIPWEPEGEVSTVGGLVTELLGRWPVRGDSVLWNGCRLEVLQASDRRPEMIAVRRLPHGELFDI